MRRLFQTRAQKRFEIHEAQIERYLLSEYARTAGTLAMIGCSETPLDAEEYRSGTPIKLYAAANARKLGARALEVQLRSVGWMSNTLTDESEKLVTGISDIVSEIAGNFDRYLLTGNKGDLKQGRNQQQPMTLFRRNLTVNSRLTSDNVIALLGCDLGTVQTRENTVQDIYEGINYGDIKYEAKNYLSPTGIHIVDSRELDLRPVAEELSPYDNGNRTSYHRLYAYVDAEDRPWPENNDWNWS